MNSRMISLAAATLVATVLATTGFASWQNASTLDTLFETQLGDDYKDHNIFDGGSATGDTVGWGNAIESASRAVWVFDLASVLTDLGYDIDRSHATEIQVTVWSDIISVSTINCDVDIGNHSTASWESKASVPDNHGSQSFTIASSVLDYINETDQDRWIAGGGCVSCSYQPDEIAISVDIPSASKVVVDSIKTLIVVGGYTPPAPPTVAEFEPKGSDVALSSPNISVTFDKAMEPEIVNYFQVTQNGVPLSHSVTLTNGDRTASVNLSAPLEKEYPVFVTADDVCQDIYSQYLDGNEDGTGSGADEDEFRWVFFPVPNEPPTVSNVTMDGVEGTMGANIYYDVADADDATVAVSVAISADTGKTFPYSYSSAGSNVSGHIGSNVGTGTGKAINWTFSSDLAQGVYGDKFAAKVIADDEFTPPTGVTATSAFQYGTQGLAAVSFNDRLWVLGGLRWVSGCNCASESDGVGFTTDGEHVNWINPTDDMVFGRRDELAAVVYNDQIVVAGGEDSSNDELNDVWTSVDGFTWVQATANAAWSPRKAQQLLVARDSLWLIGGRLSDGTCPSDVWVSTNAADWELRTPSSGITIGGGARAAYHKGQFYVMCDGLWRSDDGVSWSQVVTNDTEFCMRTYHSFISDGEKLYAASGFVDGHRMRDVWTSADGVEWTKIIDPWPQCSRTNQATAVHAGKVWVVGGYGCADANGNYLRDIFYLVE